MIQQKFENYRAIRASAGCVNDVLVGVTWVTCQREWRGWGASVGDVGGVPGWVAYQYGWCEWRASVGDVGGVPAWVRWMMCQRGWATKVSNVGDIAGNTRVLHSIVGGVLFLKLFLKTHRK